MIENLLYRSTQVPVVIWVFSNFLGSIFSYFSDRNWETVELMASPKRQSLIPKHCTQAQANAIWGSR